MSRARRNNCQLLKQNNLDNLVCSQPICLCINLPINSQISTQFSLLQCILVHYSRLCSQVIYVVLSGQPSEWTIGYPLKQYLAVTPSNSHQHTISESAKLSNQVSQQPSTQPQWPSSQPSCQPSLRRTVESSKQSTLCETVERISQVVSLLISFSVNFQASICYKSIISPAIYLINTLDNQPATLWMISLPESQVVNIILTQLIIIIELSHIRSK